eukprot:gene8238-63_t
MYPHELTLEETWSAVKHLPEFKRFQKYGFTTIKYIRCDGSTFPDLSKAKDENEKRQFLIRRECRGITFNDKTQKCVGRRFHKFFNLNEKEETLVENINFKRNFYVIEKLDGSLISPLVVNDEVRYLTMSGFTDFTNEIAYYLEKEKLKEKYEKFSKTMIERGKTPLLEFCDSNNAIVIKYNKTHLTLLNIRDIKTGEYGSYEENSKIAEEFGIPMVKRWKDAPTDVVTLLQAISLQKDKEGYVICFDEGDMYKCKTHYYACAHGISPNAKILNERIILKAICQNVIDDVISTTNFSMDRRKAILGWKEEAEQKIKDKSKIIKDVTKDSKNTFDVLLVEFLEENKSDDEVELMRSFVIKLTSDFNFRKERVEFFKWLELEGLQNVGKPKKNDKPKIIREYISEVIIEEEDEDYEEEEIDFDSFENLENDEQEKVDPVEVVICPMCKTPAEYCEFQKEWDDCKVWMEKHHPEILKKITESKQQDKDRKKKVQTLDNTKKNKNKSKKKK